MKCTRDYRLYLGQKETITYSVTGRPNKRKLFKADTVCSCTLNCNGMLRFAAWMNRILVAHDLVSIQLEVSAVTEYAPPVMIYVDAKGFSSKHLMQL